MSIGKRIREHRLDARLSQIELARRAGIAQNTLSVIELGRTPDPAISTVIKIAKALGLTLDELVSDPPKAPARRGVHYKFESSYADNPDYREYLRALDADALKREWQTWGEKMREAAGDFHNPQNFDTDTFNDAYARLRMIEEALNELDPPVARITLRRGRPAEVRFYREPTPEELAKLNEEHPDHVVVDTRVQTGRSPERPTTRRNHD